MGVSLVVQKEKFKILIHNAIYVLTIAGSLLINH